MAEDIKTMSTQLKMTSEKCMFTFSTRVLIVTDPF